jgi:uncharacterized protein GlcG (DUF336 family)
MPTHEAVKTFPTASITRSAATALVEAARQLAQDQSLAVTIAVTDAAGHLKAFERADGSPFLTADVAIDKAWTATSFGLPTHVWSAILEDDKVAQLAHRPRLVAVGGGYPVVDDGQVVGGLGVSGGTAVQDQRIAEAALDALGFTVPARHRSDTTS